MTIEKRIEARVPVKLPVTLADGSTCTTRDVSATGLFFEIDNKLELGSVVDFSIELSANGRSMLLTGQGEVVRIEALRDLTREELDAKGATGFFPIRAGEVQEIRQFIFYTVQDGRIEKVEAALPPPL